MIPEYNLPIIKTIHSICYAILIQILIIFSLLYFSITDTYADKKLSLHGLQGILVRVKAHSDMEQDGLSSSRIKSDVESKLKAMGISVLTDEKWRTSLGHPFILITINGAKIQDNWKFYTYSIIIRFFQDVTLVRKPEIGIIQASTWFHEFSGHGYLDDIRTKVIETMDIFAQDLKTSN